MRTNGERLLRGGVGLLLLMSLGVTSCSIGDHEVERPAAEPSVGLRIASFDFDESEVLAELYAQVLVSAGLPVVRLGVVGPREIVAPAMQAGLIDVVPEYSGAVARHFGDESIGISALEQLLAERGLRMLRPAPAENVNVIVTTDEFAARHGLRRVSDLAGIDSSLRFGGPAECPDRPSCLVGLAEVYGLEFNEFVPQRSLAVTAEALVREEIDVGVMFSTSAELTASTLVVLDDDKALQPDEHIVPLVRLDALELWGDSVVAGLDDLSSRLTTRDLQQLNRSAAGGVDIRAAARAWLGFTLGDD